MNTARWKILIVLALVLVVGVVLVIKKGFTASAGVPSAQSVEASETGMSATDGSIPEKKLPKLLDLGAKKCVPCKMMSPLLAELAKDYKGKMDVEFIDVWENPEAAEKYGIQSIPTQIFYDAEGKEFFRHVGFFPKEDILAKFKEKGIRFE